MNFCSWELHFYIKTESTHIILHRELLMFTCQRFIKGPFNKNTHILQALPADRQISWLKDRQQILQQHKHSVAQNVHLYSTNQIN